MAHLLGLNSRDTLVRNLRSCSVVWKESPSDFLVVIFLTKISISEISEGPPLSGPYGVTAEQMLRPEDEAKKPLVDMFPLLASCMEISEAVLSSLLGTRGGVLGLEKRALEMFESRERQAELLGEEMGSSNLCGDSNEVNEWMGSSCSAG